MRSRPGICSRKRRFDTEADAVAVALAAAIVLRPYHCSVCRRYHLTSRTKGMRTLPAPGMG
jgi:type III secretory pathway component EscU